MRVRDKSRTSNFGWKQSYGTYGPPPWQSFDEGVASLTLNDSFSDVETLDFKRRSRAGEIFNSPMEKFKYINKTLIHGLWRKSKPYGWWSTNLAWHGWYTDYHPGKDEITVDEVSRVETLAITEAYANVGNDAQVLTEIAEIKETFSFLISPVRSLVRNAKRMNYHLNAIERSERAYRRRLARWEARSHWSRTKRGPKPVPRKFSFKWGSYEVTDLASLWLAYRYALMPILYSLQDGQKLLERSVDPLKPQRVTSRSMKESRVSHEATTPYAYYSAANGDTKERHSRVGFASIKVRAGVMYVPRYELTNELGVEYHRVPAALWEAVPLSFVADWFMNGANYYDALTAKLRAQKILAAWTSTHVEFDVKGFFEMSSNSSSTTATGLAQSFVGSGEWKRRLPRTQLDTGFVVNIDLNSKRVADGLALASTMLKSALTRNKLPLGRRPSD